MSPKRFSQYIANLFPVTARTAVVALGFFVARAALAGLLLLLGSVSAPVTAAPIEGPQAVPGSPAPAVIVATMAPAPTTTTILDKTASPTLVGAAIWVDFQVVPIPSPAAYPVGGTITVSDGTGATCSRTWTPASGYEDGWRWNCNLYPATAGAKTLTATFTPADPDLFSPSTSAGVSHQVNKTSVTLSVSASPDSPVYGQEVTFEADIQPSVCTGVVFFDDGGTEIGRATLESGTATVKTFRLGAGPHRVKAVYLGTENCYEGESDVLELDVDKAATKINSLTASPNPWEYGQYVTLTAEVVPNPVRVGSTIPTGFVTFHAVPQDTGDPPVVGQESVNGEREASFTTAGFAAGLYWVYAIYEGDANYLGIDTYYLPYTVNKAETEIQFTGCPSDSYYGKSVTFEVRVKRVTPGIGTLTGKVKFEWHVHENEDFEATLGFTESGEVSFANMKPHDVGDNQEVKAKYQGDDNFKASDWAVCEHDVNKARTTTELQDPVNPTDYGQDAQFIISVKRHEDEPGLGMPTGTVNLTITPGPPSSIAEDLPVGGSLVTIVTNTLRPGGHGITAGYGGDDNFKDSTAVPIIHTVNKADSETSLESSVNPSAFGQSVTFTATVEAAGLGLFAPITPGGWVTFKDGGAAIAACPAPVLLVASEATCTTSGLSAGTHEITAEYSGDTNFKPSDDSLRQTVNTIATTTELSGPSSSAVGDSVTFTATVSETLSGNPVSDGNVTFYDGVKVLDTKALVAGVATYDTSSLSAGLHPIKAVYNGTENFLASTSQRLYHTVSLADSTTTLTSSNNPSDYGESVTFTATVTETLTGSPVVSGTVTFKDGAATLGSDDLDISGQATLTTSLLSAGTHPIKAVYGGTADLTGSTSNVLNQVVNMVTPTVTVTDNPDPTVYGAAVTLVATVAPVSGGATPTGIVSFTVGATVLGTATLNGAGQASLVTSAIPVGANQTITATYLGDNNYNSTSGTTTHTVNKAHTKTTVTTSPPSSLTDQEVTINATVTVSETVPTPGAGTPTGEVEFKVESTSLGSKSLVNGSASITHTFTVTGTFTIEAFYTNSDGNFENSDGSTMHNVNAAPADLSVTKTDSPDPVNVGDNLTYVINVTNNEADPVNVTLTDTLPPQVSFVSASGGCTHDGSALGGVVTCDLGSMAGGGSASVTIVVKVPIATPAGTVLRNTAQVNGAQSDTEETTVYRSPRRGDCNGDDAVDLADVWAIVRDIFDPTYVGTMGCDANQDRRVDAGDVPSTVLIMFTGLTAGGRGGDLNTGTEGPALTMPVQVAAVPGGLATVPVSFAANGHSITSLAFSVDYDETWLALDPADRDGNGVPDKVIFTLQGDFTPSVTFDEGDADGEVDIFIGDISPPLTSLSDGPVVFLILNVGSSPGRTQGAVLFSLDPAASFGDTSGQSVPGTATPTVRYSHQIYLPMVVH